MTPQVKLSRTDRNNNPTAFTSDVAREAGLILNTEYVVGDPFFVKLFKGKDLEGNDLFKNETYFTARLLADPIALTIKVIDKVGFFNSSFHPRWTYLQMEKDLWLRLSTVQKRYVISLMYLAEGGTELKGLFI